MKLKFWKNKLNNKAVEIYSESAQLVIEGELLLEKLELLDTPEQIKLLSKELRGHYQTLACEDRLQKSLGTINYTNPCSWSELHSLATKLYNRGAINSVPMFLHKKRLDDSPVYSRF